MDKYETEILQSREGIREKTEEYSYYMSSIHANFLQCREQDDELLQELAVLEQAKQVEKDPHSRREILESIEQINEMRTAIYDEEQALMARLSALQLEANQYRQETVQHLNNQRQGFILVEL